MCSIETAAGDEYSLKEQIPAKLDCLSRWVTCHGLDVLAQNPCHAGTPSSSFALGVHGLGRLKNNCCDEQNSHQPEYITSKPFHDVFPPSCSLICIHSESRFGLPSTPRLYRYRIPGDYKPSHQLPDPSTVRPLIGFDIGPFSGWLRRL